MKSLWQKLTTEAPRASEGGKVLALMNQKGGVGKTTMAFNLAHALARQGNKVLCLDMDPQANFSTLFGMENPTHHIHHLLINSVKELRALHVGILPDEVIRPLPALEGGGQLHILPAGQELSGFELTVAGISSPRQLILKRFIEKSGLRERYDHIVIDGPPTLGLLVVNILCAVDGVLYPFVPDSFSKQGLKNVQQVLEDIREMEICGVPKNLGYIPNLFEARRKQSREEFERMGAELTQGHVHAAFTNKAQFTRALAARKSVFEYHNADYREIQEQFLQVAQSVTQELRA